MKTIYLIRHAKSSWKEPLKTDFERDLNSRGKNDAPIIGKKLNQLGINIDLIICSTAVRTRKTAKLLCKEINYVYTKIEFKDEIYEASLANLIQLINQLPNQSNNVALIGHNPAITYLANYLTDNYIDNMPTCGVFKIELEIDNWNEVIQGVGLQKFFIYPKMF